jgi:hypothetical protein
MQYFKYRVEENYFGCPKVFYDEQPHGPLSEEDGSLHEWCSQKAEISPLFPFIDEGRLCPGISIRERDRIRLLVAALMEEAFRQGYQERK